MDITDVETAEYLESRLEEHSVGIERVSRKTEILCARSYYLMSHSEEPLRKIKPNISAESFDYLNVVKFERDTICESHDNMYIRTTITFENGNIYSYRNNFSYNLFKSLNKLKEEKEVDFLALNLFDPTELIKVDQSFKGKSYDDIDLYGGIGGKLVYSSTGGALEQKDYYSYSPAKELKDLADPNRSVLGDLDVLDAYKTWESRKPIPKPRKLKDLTDSNRSVKGELNAYSEWIKKLEKSKPLKRSKPRKLSFLFDSSIKEYMSKQGILFLMRFFDGDKYIKLANRLESMLELKKEEDDENAIQKERKGSDKID